MKRKKELKKQPVGRPFVANPKTRMFTMRITERQSDAIESLCEAAEFEKNVPVTKTWIVQKAINFGLREVAKELGIVMKRYSKKKD